MQHLAFGGKEKEACAAVQIPLKFSVPGTPTHYDRTLQDNSRTFHPFHSAVKGWYGLSEEFNPMEVLSKWVLVCGGRVVRKGECPRMTGTGQP